MSLKLNVKGIQIKLLDAEHQGYISLTDIVIYNSRFASDSRIDNWMSCRGYLEFMAMWERLNNPDFDVDAFEQIKCQVTSRDLILTPKQWVKQTAAKGIVLKAGRYGGVYAHKDIAFEFAGQFGLAFKLGLVNAFHGLEAQHNAQSDWRVRRDLTKINYRLHTDAIKRNLISADLSAEQIGDIYSAEADVINMAMFGKTAAQWREENPGEKGNIRDSADLAQLVFLANMENLNAAFIIDGLKQSERLDRLSQLATEQMNVLS